MALVERKATDSAPASLSFEGYASVTDTAYVMYDMFGEYTEKVNVGAFKSTLARAGLDVPFVLAHDPLRRMARTLTGSLRLSEDGTGLRVEADLDPADADVAYIRSKLESGLIDEMSFRFRIIGGEWSADWTEYHISEVDIHRGDVAIVGYGANPATAGAGLRSEPDALASPKVSRAVVFDDDDMDRRGRLLS